MKTLEIAAKGIGVLATTALVLSIIYDWGFLFALGIGFIELPTAMGDHIRSALVWLPNALLGLFIGAAIEFLTQRIERGLTEEEIIQSSKNPERLRKFRASPVVLFRVTAPVVVASFVLLGDSFRAILPIVLMIVWSMVSEWATSAPLIRLRRNRTVMAAFHWLPIVFFLVFFVGYNKAADLASRNVPHFKVKLTGEKPPIEVNVLRYLDKGALIVQPSTKAVSLVGWSQIASIDAIEPYKPYTGLLGGWLNKKAASNKPMQPTR